MTRPVQRRQADAARLPQGDPGLLATALAQRLLASTIPARMAYLAHDGAPRVVASWFHWTGEELVTATFASAPHVRRPARRVADLRANPRVAVTIDTESFPPEVLTLRGEVSLAERAGVVPEYALAAARYLGDDAAGAYLGGLEHPSTHMVRIALRPSWVGLLDFQGRLPDALGGVVEGAGGA